MFLSNRLRVIRAEQRVSQLRLGLAAGIHPTRLWRIENGYTEPTDPERAAIARALDVSEAEVWPAPGDPVGLRSLLVAGGRL